MTIPLYKDQTTADLITLRLNDLINKVNAEIAAGGGGGGGGGGTASNITRAQIASSSALPDGVVLSGFAVAGDLGAGAIYTATGATSAGPMAIQSADGIWYNLVVNDRLNVGWFGAKGDGVTDDAAAIQAAITYAASTSDTSQTTAGRVVYFPANKFLIKSTLTVTGLSTGIVGFGFGLVGEGIIQQNTNNIPVISFAGTNQRSMRIEGLKITYTTQQTAVMTNGLGFQFIGHAPQVNLIYNSFFHNLVFTKCFTCIGHDATPTFIAWGCRFTNITMSEFTGSAIDFSLAGGAPNNYFGNLYVGAGQATGYCFDFNAQAAMTMDNIEINTLNGNRAYNFANCRQLLLRNVRVEIGTFTEETGGLMMITGCQGFRLEGYEIQSIVFTPPTVNFGFRDVSGSIVSPFFISSMDVRDCTCNSKFYPISSAVNYGIVEPITTSNNPGYLSDVWPFDPNPAKITRGWTFPLTVQQAYTTNSSTSATTALTADDILGGSVDNTLGMTGVIAAASAMQLPLGTAMYTAIGEPVVGQTYRLRVINIGGAGSGVWTVTTNTGWTLNGTMTIDVGAWRDFYVSLLSFNNKTLILQSIGTGTFT